MLSWEEQDFVVRFIWIQISAPLLWASYWAILNCLHTASCKGLVIHRCIVRLYRVLCGLNELWLWHLVGTQSMVAAADGALIGQMNRKSWEGKRGDSKSGHGSLLTPNPSVPFSEPAGMPNPEAEAGGVEGAWVLCEDVSVPGLLAGAPHLIRVQLSKALGSSRCSWAWGWRALVDKGLEGASSGR